MNFKKIIHISAVLVVIEQVNGQNLVPNSGFEEYVSKGHARYWTQARGEFNHFYHSDLNSANGGAALGRGYHCLCMYGMQENEFMHVALGKKLEPNKSYLLSMNVRLSNAADEVSKNDLPMKLNRLDWYFTSIPLNVLNKLFITAEPSASFQYPVPHSSTWEKMAVEYHATGEEEFLTIGNITRIYEKIRRDETTDSLKNILLGIEAMETHEMDSVRYKYMMELETNNSNTNDEFSMNSLVDNKRKKQKRADKKYQEQLKKNNEVGRKIKQGQETVGKKYFGIKQKYESMIGKEQENFSVNVCFDDVSITEIKGMNVTALNTLTNTKPVEGKTMVLNNIRFNTDAYVLLDGYTQQLDELAAWMKMYPSVKVQLSGHTDNTGDEAHNVILSFQRAKAVVEYLTNKGIEKERMRYKGYGSNYALADNGSVLGKAMNRRVEVTILKADN